MKVIDEIKQMMAAGDTANAAEALKELLAKEPTNLHAKMLYGTCCQLLGDEETFKRIHDELAPEMEKLEAEEPQAEIVSLWKKYDTLFEYLIVGAMIVGTMAVGIAYIWKTVLAEQQVAAMAVLGVYAGPPMQEMRSVKVQQEMQPVEPQKESERAKQKDKIRTADEEDATVL